MCVLRYHLVKGYYITKGVFPMLESTHTHTHTQKIKMCYSEGCLTKQALSGSQLTVKKIICLIII